MQNTELVYYEIDFPVLGKHPVAFHISTGRLLFVGTELKKFLDTHPVTREQSSALSSFIKLKEKEFLINRLYKRSPSWKTFYNKELKLGLTVYIDEYGDPYLSVPDMAKGLQLPLKAAELWCHYHGVNTLPYDEEFAD